MYIVVVYQWYSLWYGLISCCYCGLSTIAGVTITMTIVKTVSGIYTLLLQFIMTQHWLSLDPPILSHARTRTQTHTNRHTQPVNFLVMAVFLRLSRTQSPRWIESLSRSFRRHAAAELRRSMASHPAAADSNTARFDFLVIGGGSGGLAGARRASELGANTAVIESHKLGGTCVSTNLKSKHTGPDHSTSTVPSAPSHMFDTSFSAKPPDSCSGSCSVAHNKHWGACYKFAANQWLQPVFKTAQTSSLLLKPIQSYMITSCIRQFFTITLLWFALFTVY